jgi:CO/xanthine dehydrogenase FAD-binding subunit
MPDYRRPQGLEEALALLAEGRWRILAGGTDLYPALANDATWGRPFGEPVLDLTAIAGLGGIVEEEAGHRIGALATWSELLEKPLPPWFDGLKIAARETGGRQVQNRATLVGNVCNASPAADGVTALLSLNAEVELASREGRRRMALADFVTGNRCTARRDDELVSALIVPRQGERTLATFLKLGARTYLVISIAMVAALVELDGEGRIGLARVVVGACSEVAQRLNELEAALIGRRLGPDLAEAVEEAHFAGLTPIDDPRASAAYRRAAAPVLVRRALAGLGAEAVVA